MDERGCTISGEGIESSAAAAQTKGEEDEVSEVDIVVLWRFGMWR